MKRGSKMKKTPELIAKVLRAHIKGIGPQMMSRLGTCSELLAKEILHENGINLAEDKERNKKMYVSPIDNAFKKE